MGAAEVRKPLCPQLMAQESEYCFAPGPGPRPGFSPPCPGVRFESQAPRAPGRGGPSVRVPATQNPACSPPAAHLTTAARVTLYPTRRARYSVSTAALDTLYPPRSLLPPAVGRLTTPAEFARPTPRPRPPPPNPRNA